MKKLTIALALCCVSLTGFAQESSEEIVNETEVSTGSDAETPSSGADETSPQHDGGCGCGKGKGKGGN
jgi:hypothetical protein